MHTLKNVAVGTTRLPLLGFLVDTTRRLVVLPPAQLGKLVGGSKALLSAARLRSRRVSSKILQRFSGLAVSCQLSLPSARFHLRRVYDCQSLVAPVSRPADGAVADLAWFSKLRTEPGVGRALWPVTLGELTTDTSPYGWGGHWQHLLPAAGFFTASQRDRHNNVKEVAVVRFCLLAFRSQLLDKEGMLQLRVDSRVAMHVINGFSSRSPASMAESRSLHAVAVLYRVTLRASWLPSVANMWAHALSRRSDPGDWRLSTPVFNELVQRYGVHTVDRFASPTKTKCARFNSLRHAPGTEAVDAFLVFWGGEENNWICLPFTHVERVLAKVRADKATVTVILPVWVALPWWAPAVAAAHEGYLLAASAGLFLSGRTLRPTPSPKWRMAVFRFVGGGLPAAAAASRQARRSRAAHRRRRFTFRSERLPGDALNVGRWRVSTPGEALMPLPPAGCAGTVWSTPPRRGTAGCGAASRSTATSSGSARSQPPRRRCWRMWAACG